MTEREAAAMRVIEGWLEVVKKLQQENAELRQRLLLIDGPESRQESRQIEAGVDD